MGRLRYYTNNGLVVFENRSTLRSVNIWEEDLQVIQDVCAWCTDAKTSPLGRVARGQYSPALLLKALEELEHARDSVDPDALTSEADRDGYIDLLTAIDDLQGVIKRIKQIA